MILEYIVYITTLYNLIKGIINFICLAVTKNMILEGEQTSASIETSTKWIKKYAKFIQTTTESGVPNGIVFGFWYVAVFTNSQTYFEDRTNIVLYTLTKKQLDELTSRKEPDNSEEDNNKQDDIKNLSVTSVRQSISKRSSQSSHFIEELTFTRICEPNKLQKKIISVISDKTDKFKFGGTFLLTGASGIGKTISSYFLAKQLEIPIIPNAQLTLAGSSLRKILDDENTFPDHKAVLVINEFDQLYKSLISGIPQITDFGAREIYSEGTLFDFIDEMYNTSNSIIILTTNYPPFDDSFGRLYREGRICKIDVDELIETAEDVEILNIN